VQACMSAPPAAPAIMEPIAVAAPALAASSAALAAGAPGGFFCSLDGLVGGFLG
jgi:hypothetical protein